MTDLSQTIAPKSDQLNADDLISGPRTITVTKVSRSESPDQPIKIHFDGDNGKPYLPCKSMRRVLVQVWGADGSQYAGRSMTLYRDDGVKFGGADVGGIRISHMSGLKERFVTALTMSKASRKPYAVLPLKDVGAPSIDPAVKAAGDQAAAGGVAAYTEWLGSLAPDVKASVRPMHKEWSARAKAADEKPAPTDDPPAESPVAAALINAITEADSPKAVAAIMDREQATLAALYTEDKAAHGRVVTAAKAKGWQG